MWPIDRRWRVEREQGAQEQSTTDALSAYHVCALLGAAGSGKSFELKRLASTEECAGREVRIQRLAAIGQTADSLQHHLSRWSAGASEATVLYLDAIDELMVPVRQTGPIVAAWIRNQLSISRPALRISCRSAVWPESVEAAINEVYGVQERCVAWLQPLSYEDIRIAALSQAIDADRFIAQVTSAGANALAQQPLSLAMLFRLFSKRNDLPHRRSDLFGEGVRILASERLERREDGTAVDIPLDDLLHAAEVLACVCLFSGREIVDLTDEPADDTLGHVQLSSLVTSTGRLDLRCLSALERCGLCEGEGTRRFRFVHRQFAEYLAGRRIARLMPHQARALLASELGWEAGVAGPLRETAAFAAMESPRLATWIAEHDPEVVGLSDVADHKLRRQATLKLLDKFRSHELTDTQMSRDHIQLAGLKYDDAESDLRPLLEPPAVDNVDLLQCVIDIIAAWKLTSMSDNLATLVLDPTVPLQVRKDAGYAIAKIGTASAKSRLIALIDGTGDEQLLDLKGLALRCNWPDAMSTATLLDALVPPRQSHYFGAYQSFLFQLDQDGFSASESRIDGLKWASRRIRRGGDYEPILRISKRIAIAALDELDNPGIADALARLLLAAAAAHASSPLVPPSDYRPDSVPIVPHALTRESVRRRVIEAVVAVASDDYHVWWIAYETPGFVIVDDFRWLLVRATDTGISMRERRHFADLARCLPWASRVDCVEAWYDHRDIEPIASAFPVPVSIELDSDEASAARKAYAERKRWEKPRPTKKLRPSPRERVASWLEACESKGWRYFAGLCKELTLHDESTHYSFTRELIETPGWIAASEDDRERIVAIAKQILLSDNEEIELAETLPLSSLLPTQATAMFLVMSQDVEWAEALPNEWWATRTWYFLRELYPHMHAESGEVKQRLFKLLIANAPDQVRQVIRRLVADKDPESKSLLSSLLYMFDHVPDSMLDGALCEDLRSATVTEDRVIEVAQFVLARGHDRATPACIELLDSAANARRDDVSVDTAVALLRQRPNESWVTVVDLLRRRPDLAPRVLGGFALACFRITEEQRQRSLLDSLGAERVAQLFGLLLQHFPPEIDVESRGTAEVLRPANAARMLQDQLISWLGNQRDYATLVALRDLENKFGDQYPWIRRPRSRVERAFRLTRWAPIRPETIAEILMANEKRLIRNSRDALEGVVAAIEDYGQRLRSHGASEVDDLWNRPRGADPTPKEEERFSDKLRDALREYFKNFAVVVDREVQLCRRKVAAVAGGAPGSELDVKYEVVGSGTLSGDPIVIPIEVKLSHNPEAVTGLKDQLVDRYMPQANADVGVYVVAYVGKVTGSRPKWNSVDSARTHLRELVTAAIEGRPGADVRALVIDATLPLAVTSNKGASKKVRKKQLAPKRGSSRQTLRRTADQKAQKKSRGHASGGAVSKRRGKRRGKS